MFRSLTTSLLWRGVLVTFASDETAGRRALFGSTGLISVLFGLFCLAYGVSSLVLAPTSRSAGNSFARVVA